MHRFVLALAALVLGAVTGSASAAEECRYGEELSKQIEAAPTCQSAHALHNQCNYGASGDVELSSLVVAKCEATFLPGLSPAKRKTYKAKLQHCQDAEAHKEGTMYIAFAVMCQEDVAVDYAREGTPGAVKASFDCRKAAKPLELFICSLADLGAADIALSQAYVAAQKTLPGEGRAVLTRSERGWLDFVVAKCAVPESGTDAASSTGTCVRGAFEARRDQLGLCLAKPAGEQAACLDAYTLAQNELPK